MNNPTFSIIIPTLNSSAKIFSCVRSIIDQSFTDFEVLVIDGLSQDDTLAIVNSFNDKRIRILAEKDHGIYDAMNKGVISAHGEWLLFLGSDDALHKNDVLAKVEKSIDPRKKVMYGNTQLRGNTNWGQDGQIYDGPFTIEKLLHKNISHQAIFYHKNIFQEIGIYNTDYCVCADYDFNLRAAAKYPLHYINVVVSNFSSGGVSTQSLDRLFISHFSRNIVKYFFLQLYKSTFSRYELDIITSGRDQLKRRTFAGLYLLMVGYFFKVKRKIIPC